jgi:hypothetical protein
LLPHRVEEKKAVHRLCRQDSFPADSPPPARRSRFRVQSLPEEILLEFFSLQADNISHDEAVNAFVSA